MSPKALLPYTGLPEGEEGYHNNKHQQGKGINQGKPTRVILLAGTVEYSIRPSTQN